jgi:cation diffusion facilitator family transporter
MTKDKSGGGQALRDDGHCCTLEYAEVSEAALRNERNTLWVILLTLVTMVVEITAGFVFGSMALLADGWHMAGHAGALGITAGAYALARRHARNPRFAFGTGKLGTLGGYSSAVVLLVVAVLMAWESVTRLIDPVEISFDWAIIVACIGLAVNLASAYLLGHHGHGHAHEDHDHEHDEDLNVKAAYMHVLADALTSLTAIFALLTGKYFGWIWMDPIMGIVGSLVIGKWAYGLIKESGKILLDHTGGFGMRTAVRAAMEAPGDCEIDDLHVWRMGPGYFAAIVSLVAEDPKPPEEYKCRLRNLPDVAHVTVEVKKKRAED